jgi:peptidoglycan glycosyltransferase
VAVYNYETGEILCLVSSPSFDPRSIPEDLETNPSYEGVFLNRFLSSTFTPGSIFKTVTLAAALEELPGVESRTWVCDGSIQIGDEIITCSATHGSQTLGDGLANSCNVIFGQLAVELGSETLAQYARKAGLTSSYSVDGISTAAGSLGLDTASDADLAWAGVGQYHDQVNPCSMLVYMGAIANGGKAALPRLIQKTGLFLTRHTSQLISADTAAIVADMMAYNVTSTYGTQRFPGMEVCAKSGTAEVGGGLTPHAWFTGFLRNDPDHPYAFLVLVENGGSGAEVAGNVAATVLKAAVAA